MVTRVGFFADFALEGLPVVGGEVGALLHLLLYVQPTPQTLEVDEPHTPTALATRKERVVVVSLELFEVVLGL